MAVDTCRQCKAVVSVRTESCPLCGLVKPAMGALTRVERGFVEQAPELPDNYHDMAQVVEPRDGVAANMTQLTLRQLADPRVSAGSWLGLGTVFAGAIMHIAHIAAPLDAGVILAGVAAVSVDSALRAWSALRVTLSVRLSHTRKLAPYKVHIKIERQLESLLSGLRTVARSVFERDWRHAGPELRQASESLLTGAAAICDRLAHYADLSLSVATLIWRNNVVAILAGPETAHEKIQSLRAKCREAEALLLRHRWLRSCGDLTAILREHMQGHEARTGLQQGEVLDRFHMGQVGPLNSDLDETFADCPHDLTFLGRSWWFQHLPPGVVDPDAAFINDESTAELRKSVQQVRRQMAQLEVQGSLDVVAAAIKGVGPGGKPSEASAEAAEVLRDAGYFGCLDIREFRPDASEVQNAVDKMMADARVALGTEKLFE